MKLLITIVAGLVVASLLLVGVIALIGSRLPKAHSAPRSIVLQQRRQQVYKVVRDFSSASTWRSDVERIEITSGADEKVRFCEHGKNGDVNYELSEDIPAERMVTRILDTDLGYSGKWTYAFADESGGTRVTITEDGEVSNVIFRFMSRYIFGHTATLDSYLTSLAHHLGETATPQ